MKQRHIPVEENDTNKTVADNFTQRLTLDINEMEAHESKFGHQSTIQEAPNMARATLGEDYKEFKKEESKCVSPAFTMDDNVSEEPHKN